MTSLSTRISFLPLALVVCLWCMAGSSSAKPATSEVPLKLALASQDYLDLQAILGKSLPGTPAEKAKVIDLLLQLLAEIDLPTLCSVIGNDTAFKEYNSMSTSNSISATPFASTRELPETDQQTTQQAPEDEDSGNENGDVNSAPTKDDDENLERNGMEKDHDDRSKNEGAAKTATNSTTSPETGNDADENSKLNSIKTRPFKVVVRPWKKRFGNNINTDGTLPFPLRLLGRKRPFLNTRYIKNTKDLKKLGMPQKYSVALPFNLMRRRKIAKLRSQGKKGNYFIRSVGIRKPKAELYSQSLVLGEWMNEHAPEDKFSSKSPTPKPGQIIRQAELAKENEIYDEDKDDLMVKNTKLGRRVMLVVRKGGKKGMKRRRVIYRKKKVNNPASRGPIQYSVVRQVKAASSPEGKDKAGQKIVKKRFFLPRESLKQRLYRAKGDRFGAGGHRIVRNGGSKRRFIPGRTRVLRVRAGPQSRAGKSSGHRRALYPDKQRVVMKAVGGGLDEYRNKGLAAFGEYADGDEYANHVDNKFRFSPSVEPTSSKDVLVPSVSTYSTGTTTTVKIAPGEATESNEDVDVDVDVDEIDYVVPTVKTETGDEDESVASDEAIDQSEEDLDVENIIGGDEFEEVLDEEEEDDNEIEPYEDEDSIDNGSSQEELVDSSTYVYGAISTTVSENADSETTFKTSTLSSQATTESTPGDDIHSTTHNIKNGNRSEVDTGKNANDSQVDNLPVENEANEMVNETNTVPPMAAYKGMASTPKAESTPTTWTHPSSTPGSTSSLDLTSEPNVDAISENEDGPSQNNRPRVAEVTESSVSDEPSLVENAKGVDISEKREATTTLENIMESIDEFYNNLFGSKTDKDALDTNEAASDKTPHANATTESSSTIPSIENNVETTTKNEVTPSTSDTADVTDTTKPVTNTTDGTKVALEPFMVPLDKDLTDERKENEKETESLQERPTSDEESKHLTSTVKSVVNSPDEASLEEDASEIEAISTDVKQSGRMEAGEEYASLTNEQPRSNLTLEALMNITTRLNATKVNQSETIKKLLEEGLRAQDSETTSAIMTETATSATAESDIEGKKLSDVVATEMDENVSEPDEVVERTTSVLDATTSLSKTQDEFETEESKNERVVVSTSTESEDGSNSEISSAEARATEEADSIGEIEDVTTLSEEGEVTDLTQMANSDNDKSTSEGHGSLNEERNALNERTLIKPSHIDFTNEDEAPINRPAGVSGPSASTRLAVSLDSTTPASNTASKSSTAHNDAETGTTTALSNGETTMASSVVSSNENVQETDASKVDVISTAIRRANQSKVEEEYASLTREQARVNLTLETLMNITTRLDATKMNQSETMLQILQERNRALTSNEGDVADVLPPKVDTTTAAAEKITTGTTPDAILTSTVKESMSEMANEDASKSTTTTASTTTTTTSTSTTTTTEAALVQEALPTMRSLSDEDKLISEVDKILNEIELNEVTTQDVATNGVETTEQTPDSENELTKSLSEEEGQEEENVKDSEVSNKLEATTKASEEYNKGLAWEPVEIQKTFEDKLKPLGDFSYWKKPQTSLFHARFSDWIGPDGRKEYLDPKSNKIDLWKAYNIALTEGGKVDGKQKLQPQTLSGSGERNYLWNARTWTNSMTNPDLNSHVKNGFYGQVDKNIQLKSGEQAGSRQSKEKDVKELPKDKNFNEDHVKNWGQRFSQGFYGRVYDQKRPSKSMFNPKVFSDQRFAFGKDNFEQAYKTKSFDKSGLPSGSKTQSGHINSPQVIVTKQSSNDVSNDKDKSGMWLDNEAAFKNSYQPKEFDKAAPQNTPLSSHPASREEKINPENQLDDVKTNAYSEQLSSATAFQSNEHLGPMGVAVPDDFNCPGLFGYFPDPEDCQSFFICSWKVPYRLSCPRGTRWNAQLNVCDWAANVPCPHQDFRSSSGIDSAEY